MYIKDDVNNHFIIKTGGINETTQVETLVLSDGTEVDMIPLKFNYTTKEYSLYIAPYEANEYDDPITCTLVINYFGRTAVYDSDNGKYYESELNTMNSFETEWTTRQGVTTREKVYGSRGNDVGSQIGAIIISEVEHSA